jgi:hypothetical protein
MSDPLTQVTERLYREFHPHVARPEIVDLVRRCRAELDTASTGALPELVERLARQRLTDLSTASDPTAAVTTRG